MEGAQERVNSYSTQQKIMLLRLRYKSTKDLWLYMTQRRKYPSSLSCIL